MSQRQVPAGQHDFDSGSETGGSSGAVIVDASCTPGKICYPQNYFYGADNLSAAKHGIPFSGPTLGQPRMAKSEIGPEVTKRNTSILSSDITCAISSTLQSIMPLELSSQPL